MVDAADLLPQDVEEKLAGRLAQVEARSRHQFVVVTIKSLDGHEIADYGRTLGNYWGIGRNGLGDGALLIVAPTERKARIETGNGLMKALTNAEAQAIMQNMILPRFREQKMADGILAGSDGIIREITQ
ncbi:TPM domain-containing protein [Sphingomonas sp. JC676]|uniref:TPM domain-containing protein n=1 Tax=Sphingomonas sp. JC676 TaxID=2768065 RepID=UPI001658614E|nr:TPM domain-containing protein [Sphingomonas sp. JC676]MBC9033305.1 TPM domain-containing protein [Sphingomonas sp. JC676]